MLGALALAAPRAHAQVEPTLDEHRVLLGVFAGVTAGAATWVTATPWGGFWRDQPDPLDWRPWVLGAAVGVAAGITTALTTPNALEAVEMQALTLGVTAATELLVLMGRGLVSIGADQCNEICHKLVLALPLLLGLTASFILGQVRGAELGPPSMISPLVLEI